MGYVKIEHKPANKFKMVQLEDQMKFQKLLNERENLVPCQLYVDKDDGTIYFVEQQTGPILDCMLHYDEDTCINDDIGLRLGRAIKI